MKTLAAALLLAPALAASPVMAQPMDHSMHHPAPSAPEPAVPTTTPAPPDAAQTAGPVGTDQRPGSAEPPPVVHDRPAHRYWDPVAMAAAEAAEMHPPAAVWSKYVIDIAELQARDGADGYRWEAEAWWGDLNRLMLKTRGEGTIGGPLDRAEAEALYARALDPWWNLTAGLRQDFGPRPARTWATLGVEGRARYQFDVHAAAYLSDKGQLTARIEAAYDQRITQRLVLQPRAELDLSAQDMPDQRTGAGLSSAELGLRLRYEIRREFAPYVGISWTRAIGRTATFVRAAGDTVTDTSAVAGVRFWF